MSGADPLRCDVIDDGDVDEPLLVIDAANRRLVIEAGDHPRIKLVTNDDVHVLDYAEMAQALRWLIGP